MKTEKITQKELLKQRAIILKKIENFEIPLKKKIKDFTDNINSKEWTPLMQKFYKDNIPYKIGTVYEVEGKLGKNKKHNRFAAYCFNPLFFGSRDGLPSKMMVVGMCGWWLDENNTPAVWDERSVFGIVNPTVFKKSDNQINNKVPKELMSNA